MPALLALSYTHTGLIFGSVSTILIIGLLSLLHYPLNRWGLLYAPKVTILLVIVILTYLLIFQIAVSLNVLSLLSISLFPVIIIALAAEKFSKKVAEEGLKPALNLMGQTLIVAGLCFLTIQSKLLESILITFPEIYAIVIVLLMNIGKWIGIRFLEYNRFAPVYQSFKA